ncbi:MAG: preprotein translocase subunit SecA [Bacteroidia bacterium]|nr:preprotein translocase subunit SecA [Bacteroidia bacterium]
MWNFLSKFFPSKKDKDVAALKPLVAAINQEYAKLRTISDDMLRAKTEDFQKRITNHLTATNSKLASLQEETQASENQDDTTHLEQIYRQIDQLTKERNQTLEAALNEILPEAFAVVKETCRRLTENKQLVVQATDWDRTIAANKPNVVINGDKAIWQNRWLVTGNEIEWNMVHYDVQLMGGVNLHQGKISEMATGEGKTLVSTLPAYLNALAGFGVHIVTVNDYLARRDCEWNGPIFEFHKIRVDVIDIHDPNTPQRQNAYLADITYGTNNEFGFDYLRDNMVTHPENLVQRKLHYAMIDEVDSVLVDEARTPLIISGPVPQGDKHEFHLLKPRIERLVQEQRRVVNECLNKAKLLIDKNDTTQGGLMLLRAHRGLPKYKPLIKYLSEKGVKAVLNKSEAHYMQDNSKNMHIVDEELYFVIDEKNNSSELTDKGRELITKQGEDHDFFVLPDIAAMLNEIEYSANISDAERIQRKEDLSRSYSEKSERLHSVQQLLKAYCLFEKDIQYIVQDGKVMIVDEQTGRVLPGRRYSDGLHQAIEAKENVRVEAATQTFATITLQNYFRMYHKLAGMTGTAETEAAELYQIYKLDVTVILTNKLIIRKDADDLVYKTKREKYNAIIEEIVSLSQAGRPVLVGTTSVEVSELLSKMLSLQKIKHNVLNAKQHQREAEIVAEAGTAGTVTIATNMAGRGTDIKLGPGVKEAGGLAIIGSERHESRRIDRQLRGRAGRQGDPGSSQFFVSLEDDLMRLFGSEKIAGIMDRLGHKEGEVIQHSMISRSITNAQKKVEENHFGMRKRLLEYDDVMNSQREVIYKRRRNALFGDRIRVDFEDMLYDTCQNIIQKSSDAETLRLEALRTLAIDPTITDKDLEHKKQEDLIQDLFELAKNQYKVRTERIAEIITSSIKAVIGQIPPQVNYVEVALTDGSSVIGLPLPIRQIAQEHGKYLIDLLERTIILQVIDRNWMEHLREMDDLRQSVQNAVFEQKDPLLVYKFQAFEIFQQMLSTINFQTLSFLFRAQIANPPEEQKRFNTTQAAPKRDDFSKLSAKHEEEHKEQSKSKNYVIQDDEYADENPHTDDRPLSRAERRKLERNKKR